MADETTQKALTLAPSLSETHAARAITLAMLWRWSEAELEFRRALELNPNNATAHYFYGFVLLVPQKRFEEGLNELHTALSLDPLSPIVNTNLAATFFAAHRYPESLAQFQKTLERDPGFGPAHLKLGYLYTVTGRFGDAISESRKYRSIEGSFAPDAKGYLSLVQAMYPKEDEEWFPHIAAAYALNGNTEKALEYLEKAYDVQSVELVMGIRSPALDSLHSEPRYQDLVRRMGLPE